MNDLTIGYVKDGARCRVGFYLPDTFNMLPFSSALEPLRIANRLSGQSLYQWSLITDTGDAVVASNGIVHQADLAVDAVRNLDTLIICGPFYARDIKEEPLLPWLRREYKSGCRMIGLETGCHALGLAGLLEGKRCTTHWENREEFEKSWPDHALTNYIYEVDEQIATCSGGAAPIDMMLHMIEHDHGHELSASVADSMIHPHVRNAGEPQKMDLVSRTGITHPVILECIQLIEANIEQPLTPDELAGLVDISKRQLERLFLRYLNTSPARYYLTLRLEAARALLETTSMKIIDVALATGFKSAGHFSSRYLSSYGITPSQVRADSIQARARK